MQIVSAVDDAYVPHFGAMLHSLWLHNPRAQVHLLAMDVADHNRRRLQDFARALGIALELIDIPAARLADMPVNEGYSSAVYMRLLTPECLPGIGRALYLDADITVNGRLDALFGMDMRGMSLCAALDLESTMLNEARFFGIEGPVPYVNSGVLLLDLDQWRREDLAGRIMAYAKANASRLGLMDQSALNWLLAGRIEFIGKEWNYLDFGDEAIGDPKLIHYAGPVKPWSRRSAPFHELYGFHLRRTPWRDPEAPRQPPGSALAQAFGGLRGRSPGKVATHTEAVAAKALFRARKLLWRRRLGL